MKGLVVLVVCCIAFHTTYGLTMAQLKNSARVMKNVCQPKNNVSNDLIENISKGVFINSRNVKCYIACVLQMAQTIKNGKLNYNSAMRQIDLLFPDDMKASAKKALEECRTVPDGYTDICDASFEMAKCMYKANPENFVFP